VGASSVADGGNSHIYSGILFHGLKFLVSECTIWKGCIYLVYIHSTQDG